MTKKIDNTSTLDDAKSFMKQLQDNHREWNQPREWLAGIRKFAEKILAEKTPEQEKFAGAIQPILTGQVKTPYRRLGWSLTEEQKIAMEIKLRVDDVEQAMESQDIDGAVMASLKLAWHLSSHTKFVDWKQKKKAADVRHEKTRKKKEIWLNDALEELKTDIEEKTESQEEWKHSDYLNNLKKKKKFKDAAKAWHDELRKHFIDWLIDEKGRKDLVRGI